MSQSGNSLENTRGDIRQRDTAQQAREPRTEPSAERYCVAREYKLEPVALVSELEVTPSYIGNNTSERTVTPPFLRRYALPQGTRIDRNVTRRRGTAAATERFLKAVNTEPKKETRPVGGDVGWFDPELGFGPEGGTRNVKPAAEGGIPVSPEIVITEPGLSKEPEKVGTSLPAHISTGIFHPSRQSFFSSWHGPSISPTRSEEGTTGKVGWNYSLSNFPPIVPKSRQPPVPAVGEIKTSTSDSPVVAAQVPAATQTPSNLQVSTAATPKLDSSTELPGFVRGFHPPLPQDSPEREESPPPLPTRSPPRLSSISSLGEPVEYYYGEDEDNQQPQRSECDDVGDLRQLLEKLNIDREPEPDAHEDLINFTLNESQKVDEIIQEISDLRQQIADRQPEVPEESSETLQKKVGPREPQAGAQQLSHVEKVLLAKLQETNQRLCRVTNLWKDSKQQIAYLEQELKKAATDLQQRKEHFETVSKGNLESFYQREKELKESNIELLQQINQLQSEKVRIRQEEKELRTDLTKDLNRKLAKLTEIENKDLKDLHEVIREQDIRLAAIDASRKELSEELSARLKTELELREQIVIETTCKEQAQQELEALLREIEARERDRERAQIEEKKREEELLARTQPVSGVRQRLSSTVDPQADLHADLAGVGDISPIFRENKAPKKVAFAGEPVDVISRLGLGLGETVLADIFPEAPTKVEAEKPLEEDRSQATSRLEPFQEFHVPGKVEHWDVFDPSQVASRTCDSSDGELPAKSKHTSGITSSLPGLDRPQEGISGSGRSLRERYRILNSPPLGDIELPERDQSNFVGNSRSNHNMSKFDLLTKLSKPQPFAGKEYESGREWLRRFDSYCIAGGYNPHEIPPGSDIDGQFRAGMISMLQGAAAVWLDSLPSEERESYRKLRKAFEERWVLPYLTGTRLAEETKLANRVQGPQETAESLYQDLATMCHKMGKGEQDLMIHFVRSLRPEIQDRVVTGCPRDMMTALQMASSAEARLGSIPFAPSLTAMLEQNPHLAALQKQVKDLQASQDQLKQEKSKVACTYCQKPGHTQADCRIYKKDREQESQDSIQQAIQQAAQRAAQEAARQATQQSSQQGAQGLQQQKPKPRPRKSFEGQCYNCKQKGHISRNCPQPRKPNPNREQDSVIEDLRKRIAELESHKGKDKDPK